MEILTENPVFVYWNLHKQMWSIKDQVTKKVIGHAKFFCLGDCQFKVSEKGRQRVLKTGQKNVHAGVVGSLVGSSLTATNGPVIAQVTYNPYTHEKFKTMRFKADVDKADCCIFTEDKKVFAINPTGANSD